MTSLRKPTPKVKESKPLFERGERVVLQGLSVPHFNGQHGSIALEGGKVVLPNGQYSVHLDRLDPVGLHVNPENICRIMSKISESDRVSVADGVLANPQEGMLLMNFLNMFKWLVANKYLNDEVANEMENIPKLPPSKRMEYNAYMIKNWREFKPDKSEKLKAENTVCVFMSVFQFIAGFQMHPAQKQFVVKALNSPAAMQSWHMGIQEDFWFVGRDYYGTLVVPQSNLMSVYRIVGLFKNGPAVYKKSPEESASMNKVPTKMKKITILPWYGRLLYDTTTLPPPNELERADANLATQLHAVVLKAIQENRIIDHFSQLHHGPTQPRWQQQQQQQQQQYQLKSPPQGTANNNSAGLN